MVTFTECFDTSKLRGIRNESDALILKYLKNYEVPWNEEGGEFAIYEALLQAGYVFWNEHNQSKDRSYKVGMIEYTNLLVSISEDFLEKPAPYVEDCTAIKTMITADELIDTVVEDAREIFKDVMMSTTIGKWIAESCLRFAPDAFLRRELDLNVANEDKNETSYESEPPYKHLSRYYGDPNAIYARNIKDSDGFEHVVTLPKRDWDYWDWLLSIGCRSRELIESVDDMFVENMGKYSFSMCMSTYIYELYKYRESENLPCPPWANADESN